MTSHARGELAGSHVQHRAAGRVLVVILKVDFFPIPSLIRRPRSLRSLWNFAMKLTAKKLESWGYPSYSEDRMIAAWWQCQRVPDGWTDGFTLASTALWRAIKIQEKFPPTLWAYFANGPNGVASIAPTLIIVDQELYSSCIRRGNAVIRAQRASGQPYATASGASVGRCSSLPSSCTSMDAYIFTWRVILPNFTPIQFETTEPWAFLKSVAPTRRTTRWV